jgi:hypothetical protein
MCNILGARLDPPRSEATREAKLQYCNISSCRKVPKKRVYRGQMQCNHVDLDFVVYYARVRQYGGSTSDK